MGDVEPPPADAVDPDAAAGPSDVPAPPEVTHPCQLGLPIGLDPAALDPATEATATGAWLRAVPADGWSVDRRMITASAGDIDGDGRADLVLGNATFELLVNCGDAGFARVELPHLDGSRPTASYIIDVDDDGLVDILVGGASGQVWTIWQTSPWVFELGEDLIFYPDDRERAATSFGVRDDVVHVGMNRFPPDVLVAPGEVSDENFARNHVPDAWLRLGPELEVWSPAVDPESEACWDAPTYVSTFLPRHQWGLGDLLYVGNDFGADCLSSVPVGAGGEGLGLYPPADPGGPLGKRLATMGADFHFEGTSVAMITSDFVREPHLWLIGPEGAVVQADERLNFASTFGYKITWGVSLEDFDGDGHRDALIAHAALAFDDADKQAEIDWFTKSLSPGGVHALAGQPDGAFVEDTALAPALPEEAGYYALIAADVVGNDGFGDGCPDLLMLPMVSLPTANHPPELLPNFLGEAELLRCTMPRDFVGVRLPRTRWATRAVAQLELSDGTIRWEPVRASAHMAGSRDAVAAFTLLPGEVVAFLRVYTGAGAPLEIPSPPVGSYVQVTQP